MLTSGQVAQYETFGFLMLKHWLHPDEASAIQRDFGVVWREAASGRAWSGDQTETHQPFIERRTSLTKLAEDDRVTGVVEQLLGPNVVWGEGQLGHVMLATVVGTVTTSEV